MGRNPSNKKQQSQSLTVKRNKKEIDDEEDETVEESSESFKEEEEEESSTEASVDEELSTDHESSTDKENDKGDGGEDEDKEEEEEEEEEEEKSVSKKPSPVVKSKMGKNSPAAPTLTSPAVAPIRHKNSPSSVSNSTNTLSKNKKTPLSNASSPLTTKGFSPLARKGSPIFSSYLPSKSINAIINGERIFELELEQKEPGDVNDPCPTDVESLKRNTVISRTAVSKIGKQDSFGRDHGWKKDPLTQQWRRSSIVLNPGSEMHKTVETLMSRKASMETPFFEPKSTPQNVTDGLLPFDVYRKEGAKFILTKKDGLYYWPMKIMGKEITLKLSTARRSLSISETDADTLDMEFHPDEFVCFYPSKKTQVYSTTVTCHNLLSNSKVRIQRYLIHIGTGNYASRIGLIGSTDKVCLYSLFRFKTDFCSIWMDEGYIFFGDAAIPPPCYDKIHMMPIQKKEKPFIVLPCHQFSCSDVILSKSQYSIFVHFEMPYIVLPTFLFEKVTEIFSKQFGLFNVYIEESWERVGAKKDQLPIFKIELLTENKKKIALTIPPEVYLLRMEKTPDKCQLLFWPAKHTKCIYIGPSVLHHRKIAFSCSKRLFWIQ